MRKYRVKRILAKLIGGVIIGFSFGVAAASDEFDQFDINRDNQISSYEFARAVIAFGYGEMVDEFAAADEDQN